MHLVPDFSQNLAPDEKSHELGDYEGPLLFKYNFLTYVDPYVANLAGRYVDPYVDPYVADLVGRYVDPYVGCSKKISGAQHLQRTKTS